MNPPLRTIKSWVSRLGSFSTLQKTVLAEAVDRYFFKIQNYKGFKEAILAYKTERIFLDIGFGDGLSLIKLAQQFPDVLILGFEPHLSGVAHCLIKKQQLNINNIIIFQGDVLDYLDDDSMPKASRVHLYFSDPWPKIRHHKRRLVQINFLALLAQRLSPQAIIHFATDWEDYAQHMTYCFEQQESFTLIQLDDLPLRDRFYRPVTKYEQRGITLGHQISEFYARLKDF
jgi:tRNA (guanine-N7-)-methyltransferase